MLETMVTTQVASSKLSPEQRKAMEEDVSRNIMNTKLPGAIATALKASTDVVSPEQLSKTVAGLLEGYVKSEVLTQELAALSTTNAGVEQLKTELENVKQELAKLQDDVKLDELAATTRAFRELQEKVDVMEGRIGSGTSTADASDEDGIIKLIHRQLALYDADKTGRVDYAARAGNGAIHSASPTFAPTCGRGQPGTPKSFMGTLKQALGKLISDAPQPCGYVTQPHQVIETNTDLGQCWPMAGSNGWIVIKLREPIIPDAITYEHLAPSNAADFTTAPKTYSVYGVVDAQNGTITNLVPLAINETFSDSTTFRWQTRPLAAHGKAYRTIKFVVEENHGSPLYTCLYRVRIHGKPFARLSAAEQREAYPPGTPGAAAARSQPSTPP